MSKVLDLLRGIIGSPAVVGAARGVLEAAVMAGVVAAASYVTGWASGDAQWALPAILFAVRSIEGFADHIDPSKKSAPEA